MGTRASYAIVRNGKVEIFRDTYGAHVWHQMFWGPELAEVKIRLASPSHELFSDRWCEGGLAMNFDRREIAIFSHGYVAYDLFRRDVWLRLLRRMWQGWEVVWATYGVLDLANLAGVPQATVIEHERDLSGLEDFDPVNCQAWHDGAIGETFISVENNGRALYMIDASWPEILFLGPELLNRLPTSWQAPLDSGVPMHGLRLEVGPQKLTYWSCKQEFSWVLPEVHLAWSNWDVAHDDTIFEEHVLEFRERYNPPDKSAVLAELIARLQEDDFEELRYQAADLSLLPSLPDAGCRERLLRGAVGVS